jgi:putative membrane protein
MSKDKISHDRFVLMERKLYWGIMTPGAILTILFGALLVQYHGLPGWLQLKIVLVIFLAIYHIWCGLILKSFKKEENTKSHKWYRVFNEVPVILLFAIIYLVVFKPF